MEKADRKQHWENIYQTKNLKEVSWYQSKPTISLEFLNTFSLANDARIIDIGGGDSLFVDELLKLGYSNITVLDISASSLERAKERLGEKASKIKWIVADAAEFIPQEQYDFWHDRAAFHFLTTELEISNYVNNLEKFIAKDGVLVMGTFSENGPEKCSGIEIKQYTESSMSQLLNRVFEKIKCIYTDHLTPFNTIQNFVFCSFKKQSIA
ncbi:MAG: methyltransferase domain-containing protein [Oligoflexus sp.]|nr:methyltransferase domain-containing protein [Pseudopedobacter sp.]